MHSHFTRDMGKNFMPLSNFTLNVAFGKVSVIIPSILIGPCLAINKQLIFLVNDRESILYAQNELMENHLQLVQSSHPKL